jgi:hypothetical protein
MKLGIGVVLFLIVCNIAFWGGVFYLAYRVISGLGF